MLSLSCVLALWLQASESTGSGQQYLVAVLGISILSLLVAAGLSKYVISQDTGTPQMQKISNAIKQGAEAYFDNPAATSKDRMLIPRTAKRYCCPDPVDSLACSH